MGIVAHYYMDVELQGVLQALKQTPGMQNRVGIADSLKMGDLAVQMCQTDKVEGVICLGVDFMAESVQAILSKNECSHVPVYRATARHIGCSLAESAEGDAYKAWLQKEATTNTLHVVYINTSLETKAVSSALVPTITCTSSNVLQTILQAAVQVPMSASCMGPTRTWEIIFGPCSLWWWNHLTGQTTKLPPSCIHNIPKLPSKISEITWSSFLKEIV